MGELIDRYIRGILPQKKKSQKKQMAQLLWWKEQIGHHALSDEYWRSYPNLKPWPAAKGKSIGDDFIAGVDLLAWVSQGVQIYT